MNRPILKKNQLVKKVSDYSNIEFDTRDELKAAFKSALNEYNAHDLLGLEGASVSVEHFPILYKLDKPSRACREAGITHGIIWVYPYARLARGENGEAVEKFTLMYKPHGGSAQYATEARYAIANSNHVHASVMAAEIMAARRR